jgi:hypothetical protein
MPDPRFLKPLHAAGMEALTEYLREVSGKDQIPPKLEEALEAYAQAKINYARQNPDTVPAYREAEKILKKVMADHAALFADSEKGNAAEIAKHNIEFAYMAYDGALSDLMANQDKLNLLTYGAGAAIEAKPFPRLSPQGQSQFIESKDLIYSIKDLIQIVREASMRVKPEGILKLEGIEADSRIAIQKALLELTEARIKLARSGPPYDIAAFKAENAAYRHAQDVLETHAGELQLNESEARMLITQYSEHLPRSQHFQAVCQRGRSGGHGLGAA